MCEVVLTTRKTTSTAVDYRGQLQPVAEEKEESCRRDTGRPNLVDAAGAAGAKEQAETQPSSSRGAGVQEVEVEAVERASG